MATFPSLHELLNYEVVFFDLDNTIYPYDPAHKSALNVTLSQFAGHHKMSEENAKELYGTARKTINHRLHGQASSHSRLLYFKEMIQMNSGKALHSDALKFEKTYWQHFLSVMSIDHSALKLIRQLAKKGIPLGIITDLTTQIQLQKMKKLKIERYFRHVVTSEEVGVEKPDPKIFHFALDKFGISADKAVLIGDNSKTDGGSESIGIKYIQI